MRIQELLVGWRAREREQWWSEAKPMWGPGAMPLARRSGDDAPLKQLTTYWQLNDKLFNENGTLLFNS